MKVEKLDYKLVMALDSVIAEQSFEGAAKKLHITQSAVSQRIKQLEQWLAQPVLIRSTPIEATAIGQKLLSHYQKIKQLESSLLDELRPELTNTTQQIAIALNADTLATWFIPAMTPVLKTQKIALDLKVANEAVSHELLKKGEVFGAISSQSTSFSGGKAVHLGMLEYVLCASPEFISQYFSSGVNATSLQFAPAISFDSQDTMHTSFIKQHFDLNANDYPRHQVRSSEAFVNMSLAGVAYSLLPTTQAQAFLDNGELIDIAPSLRIQQQLYWHSWHLERGIYREVSQAIVKFAQELLAK
ncbi:LysR family transcriptional regulator ArgP [Thalassotalea sp. LPB0316]|uniref:LysR family transcriptional regulator ArgP n=1 Tax=Thalassotalea sp. LPB0316 TaxID=2769490 RepID=UPI001866EA8B|nr:LysR family transcriptional regulator ArgP [Thalassotalea sp. LPB0316]QOL25324.1 LysR family transcriptional regulator ArgP [Thalassotalea sp. LPB0316]